MGCWSIGLYLSSTRDYQQDLGQADGRFCYVARGMDYEHFRPLEPHRNMDYLDHQPHMQHWRLHKERGSLGDNLRVLRKTIDAWVIMRYC